MHDNNVHSSIRTRRSGYRFFATHLQHKLLHTTHRIVTLSYLSISISHSKLCLLQPEVLILARRPVELVAAISKPSVASCAVHPRLSAQSQLLPAASPLLPLRNPALSLEHAQPHPPPPLVPPRPHQLVVLPHLPLPPLLLLTAPLPISAFARRRPAPSSQNMA